METSKEQVIIADTSGLVSLFIPGDHNHEPGEIGKVGLGHLVIEGLVGHGGAKEGIEATSRLCHRR